MSTKGVHNARALAGIIAGSVFGGLVFITSLLLGIRCWRLKRKRVEVIPEVISERNGIRHGTPFLFTTMVGRTREATPFKYTPVAPSLEGSRGVFQSTEDTQSTPVADPTSIAESSAGERTQSAGDVNSAAYWKREAEVLRQQLAELTRHPGDLPPGYSPSNT